MYSHCCWFVAALHNAAGNYLKSGRIEKAIETYEKVLEMEAYPDPLSLSTSTSDTLCFLEYQFISCVHVCSYTSVATSE